MKSFTLRLERLSLPFDANEVFEKARTTTSILEKEMIKLVSSLRSMLKSIQNIKFSRANSNEKLFVQITMKSDAF